MFLIGIADTTAGEQQLKYKIGAKLYFNRYGTYQECEVVSVLENTSRYRVQYKYIAYNGENKGNDLIAESKIFPTINDCIDAEIKDLNTKIEYLQKDIEKLNKRRT